MPVPIKNLTLTELTEQLRAWGEPAFRAKAGARLDLREARQELRRDDQPSRLHCAIGWRPSTLFARCNTSGFSARRTPRGSTSSAWPTAPVESVLIPASPALYGEASDRRTVCVSTQVGCAYGCKFCASGLDGLTRNLEPGEIVDQILEIEELSGERVSNLVFMGMGEPLANFANVMKAIEILNAPWGVGIGARRITLSTSGLAPQIRQLGDQPLQVRLAVSLHGATDEVRQQIMPVNRKYPLSELLEACEYYASRKKQRITFEYYPDRERQRSSGGCGCARAGSPAHRRQGKLHPV
jgi:23S rRNA (adenine2503-C2)-methyltransferase